MCKIRYSAHFTDIYGLTDSAMYTVQFFFLNLTASGETVIYYSTNNGPDQRIALPAGESTVTTQISLLAGNANTLDMRHPFVAQLFSIYVTPPAGQYFSADNFTLVNDAPTRVICPPGTCRPSGSKIKNLSPTSFARVTMPSDSSDASSTTTSKYVEITYINNDVALASSWTDGRNARNITVQVNSAPAVRLEVPLSGRSSELFSPGMGWYDSSTLGVLVPGFGGRSGGDVITVGNDRTRLGNGITWNGADLVGIRVF